MIVMYNLYGNSKTFGKIGNKLGEFYHPTDVIMKTINNKHFLYVADTGNHRVQRF